MLELHSLSHYFSYRQPFSAEISVNVLTSCIPSYLFSSNLLVDYNALVVARSPWFHTTDQLSFWRLIPHKWIQLELCYLDLVQNRNIELGAMSANYVVDIVETKFYIFSQPYNSILNQDKRMYWFHLSTWQSFLVRKIYSITSCLNCSIWWCCEVRLYPTTPQPIFIMYMKTILIELHHLKCSNTQ